MNLIGSSLTGSIPSSIFNISSLRIINFSNNTLSGSLPVDMCNHLPKLARLYLYLNQIQGHIPSDLYKCRELQVLSLSFNGFNGGIRKEIANLTMLKELYLRENNLKGTLPDEIGNLNLQTLDVYGNTLTGTIPFKIFNVSTMKILNLGFNNFSGNLPLDMGFWLPNLEELYLIMNKLSGTIPSSISNASKLTIISMSMNSFTGSIPNTLGSLTLLWKLFLHTNSLKGESSTPELRIFSSLTNCRQLEVLRISLNPLNGILPMSVGNLSTRLLVFDAFGCKIRGNIPSGIGNLSNLVILRLGSNHLTGPIPKSLERLQNLVRLHLQNNALKGSIPGDLCRLGKLGDLSVSANMLYGQIPTCLGELKSLRWLYLDSNRLSSKVPSNLWSLEDLLGLNLSSNFLTGELPLYVGNLKVITLIDLSRNQLSGTISNTIGGAQSLVSLSLSHNKIQGPIPRSLGNLVSLELLDLSSNNLSGKIPKSLEELRYLEYLNVSFNRLQGEIPTGGHFANFTARSFLHNDALCGEPRLQVPPCKTNKNGRSRLKIVPVLKFILPSIALAFLVIALIFLLKIYRKQEIELHTEKDISPFAWKKVSYQELLQATKAFGETNLIGMGSYGSVYKGTLLDGMNIVVKVFNLQLEGAFKSFDAECEVMRNIRHRNLIKIISSCSNMDFKALILEYMPNGSLEEWLYSHNYCLDILQRLNIMIDVAFALEYLHHDHATPIIHCDLKPSNVLLDEDMVARVADFGIAKLLGEGDLMVQTMTLATIGYMAPEYGIEGRVSTKCDVYSYGILLMETFSRKKPTDEMFAGEVSLKRWVKEALKGSIIEIVDTNMIKRDDENFSAKVDCASSIFRLAMDCSNDSAKERINMIDALATLKKIKTSFLANIGTTLKDEAIKINMYHF
ncbi:receptor kinase-like protein Xa21 [Cornus florida]|uniref:receptor kinase-like protein Xa21 n=1 Tax=Cornus florida TaxID=4283 RepID=UPI00289A5A1F|nr:receptor kinase-like protein Xa21 [Cornus florida]